MVDPVDYPGAPRWVKVSGLLALLAVVAFVGTHLAGGGFRNHFSGHAPAASHSARQP